MTEGQDGRACVKSPTVGVTVSVATSYSWGMQGSLGTAILTIKKKLMAEASRASEI